MFGQQKNNRFLLSLKLPFIRKKPCNCFLKFICISELSWNFFEKYKCSIFVFCFFFFFGQSSRYVSNEQSCLKSTGLYEDLLLLFALVYFFYFIFSTPISFSYVFQFFHLFFFLMFFLKPFSSVVEKLLYTNINNMNIICILGSF